MVCTGSLVSSPAGKEDTPEQLVKKTLSRLPRYIEEDNQPEERPTILYIPYICGTSEKLEKACAPLGVKTVFKVQRTMRQLLVQVREDPL